MSFELPKDAEGREISLDTEVLYQGDGKEYTVIKWECGFCPRNTASEWGVYLAHNGSQEYCTPERMYLTPPDSWEKLEEDLDRCIEADCVSLGVSLVLEDIKQRIRKLRGED